MALRRPRLVSKSLTVAFVVALSLVASSCGSSSDNGGSDNGDSAKTSTADKAAAEEILAPFTGHPGPFPVTEPLKKKLPAGSKISFLQCPTNICVFISSLLQPAADAMGIKLNVVKAGSASVTDMQSALSTIISGEPAGVVLAGVDLAQISPQLKELDDKGIPVATVGIIDAEKHDVDVAIQSNNAQELIGRLQASFAIRHRGDEANAVFYNTPELSFSSFQLKYFTEQMKELCADCEVRSTVLPLSTLATTATSAIISDLQSHPDTNVAIFPTPEAAQGLASALKTAGLDVSTSIGAPTPSNLQDIRDGGLTAGLGTDIGVMTWMSVDALARLATGQELEGGDLAGIAPIQLLEKSDVTFDPTKGFSAYPDYQERFKKLWAGGSE